MLDANSDGYVTQAEHAAGARKMFEKMDADRDGRVTANEMEQSHDMHARKNAEHQASSEGRHDKGKTHEASAAEKIKKIDTNNDGILTAAEHEQGSRRMFTEMDADGDGRLSKDELKIRTRTDEQQGRRQAREALVNQPKSQSTNPGSGSAASRGLRSPFFLLSHRAAAFPAAAFSSTSAWTRRRCPRSHAFSSALTRFGDVE